MDPKKLVRKILLRSLDVMLEKILKTWRRLWIDGRDAILEQLDRGSTSRAQDSVF